MSFFTTNRFVNSSKEFEGLTVARILSQEKGLYRAVTAIGE